MCSSQMLNSQTTAPEAGTEVPDEPGHLSYVAFETQKGAFCADLTPVHAGGPIRQMDPCDGSCKAFPACIHT
jgi:hypothetical protein